MQFTWAPSPSLGPQAQVWTEVALDGNCQLTTQTASRLPKQKLSPCLSRSLTAECGSVSDGAPDGFCWDYLCGDGNEQIQDRDDLEDNNLKRRVDDFVKQAMIMARTRKGDLDTMNVRHTARHQTGSDHSCCVCLAPL
jgi:hypothetical protein